MQDLRDKVAVVTGAASGIGLGMATRFAEEGMRVVLADIERGPLDAASAALRDRGFDVHGILIDVSDPESLRGLADETLNRYRAVHVLCNNAGINVGAVNIWEATSKDWQWALSVNLWGVIHGLQTFLPIMLARGEEGHIVNTASIDGLMPATRVYSVTKHAVVALSEALYFNLQQTTAKIHASVLCPALVNTRVAYSARNRPPALQNDPGSFQAVRETERNARSAHLAAELGIAPAQVAAAVVEAIREERFYVLTHDSYDEAIATHADDVLKRRNPTPYRGTIDRLSQARNSS